MAFGIPNQADAIFEPQAAPDATDIAAMVAGCEGTGVATGCDVTAQGTPDMTVAVAAGAVTLKTSAVQVAAGNVTVTAADATNPRKDIVVVDDTGAKSVVAGTAAADPVKPAIPADSVLLAEVYVPAADTAIGSTQITDKRVMVAEQFVRKTADESVTSSTTLQNDDALALAVGANEVWEVEASIRYSGASATPDLKMDFTSPAGASGVLAAFGSVSTGDVHQAPQEWSITGAFTQTFGTGGGVRTVLAKGVLITAGTAGNLQCRWAQNTSSADATTVKANSYIRARRVA